MEIWIVLAVIVVIGLFLVTTYNRLVTLRQRVREAWSDIDVQLKRRYDLIPNLVRTVQGAANFEKSTLEAVIGARSRVGQVTMGGGAPGTQSNLPNSPQAMAQFEAAQGALSNALSRLLVVVERYPDLKSNQNFLELQSQLEGTENRIAVERRRYNEVVQQFNSSVQKFPANLVANMFGFVAKAYFRGVAGSNVAPEVNFQPFGNQPAPATATTGTR